MGNNETIKIQLNGRATAMGFFPLGHYYCWLLLPFVAVVIAASLYLLLAMALVMAWKSSPVVLLPFIFYVCYLCVDLHKEECWRHDGFYFICELRIAHGFTRRAVHSYTLVGWCNMAWQKQKQKPLHECVYHLTADDDISPVHHYHWSLHKNSPKTNFCTN